MKIRHLFGDATVRQMMLDAAKQSAVVTNNPCVDAEYKFGGSTAELKALLFDSAGKLTEGVLKQSIDETGCGVSHVLNVLVYVKPDQTLGVSQAIPGTTHADPLLQRDVGRTLVSVVKVASGEPSDTCKTIYVADTQYVGPEGTALEGVTGLPWREIWTVVTCTKRTVVPMLFVPDKTGTSFQVGPINKVKAEPLS